MTKIRLDTQVQWVAPAGSTIDADLYKYSIVTSVNSWNLTVALKNYLWQDPSATTPVKWQDWSWTIRTITSAVSSILGSWFNMFNAWSSELATKEIDFFTYIWRKTSNWAFYLIPARFPNAIVKEDFSTTMTHEKWGAYADNLDAWDKVVNIWRFNAILSGGAGYTWSLPSTSVIINRPCFETRWLDYTPILSWSNGGSWVNIVTEWKYKLISNETFIQIRVSVLDKWTLSWAIQISIPFGVGNNLSELPLNWFYSNYWSNPTPWLWVPVLNQWSNCIWILVWVDTGAATFEDLTWQPRIRIKDSYNI